MALELLTSFPDLDALIVPVGGGGLIAGCALAARALCALVDDIVVVSEQAIEHAMFLLLDREKLVAEGAGAAALAALLDQRQRFAGQRVGLVVSGGNVDARILSAIMLRGLAQEGQLVRLSIEISDAPGTLARVAEAIGAGGGNIVEIRHLRLAHHIPVKRAELDAVVECRGRGHVDDILSRLQRFGFSARLMEDVERDQELLSSGGTPAMSENGPS